MNISLTLHKIERCREEMVSLAEKHGLSSDEVIHASIRLDRLLNEYHRLKETPEKPNQYKDIGNR
ncbi:MAG TPA: aspartyl-phosphate phosphatase Spo0E family protein [Virgibacillus sp.]|nr:aspartyl-phosphate phosphatase Spo0E family protein [Virgibacillus sp.]